MGIVYKLTSPVGKVYVGQCKRKNRRTKKPMSASKMLSMRWNEHCRGSSGCVAIKKAIAKYGKTSFQKEVLVEVNDEELDNLERKFIRLFDSTKSRFGYNRTDGGEGGGFAIPSVRSKMLRPDSTWLKAQKSAETAKKKQTGLSKAKDNDPNIEIRRKKNAKKACQDPQYRVRQSFIQKESWRTSSKRENRRRTALRKREELLQMLPPDERAKKRKKLEAAAAATKRWKDKQKRTTHERD